MDAIFNPVNPAALTAPATGEEWVVRLEIDGLVGDAAAAVEQFAARHPNQTGTGGLSDCFCAAVEAGALRTMPLINGVSAALWELVEHDFRVHVVSHRLSRCPDKSAAVIDTIKWLHRPLPGRPERQTVPYHELLFVVDGTASIGRAYLELVPPPVSQPAAPPVIVVFDRPDNRHLPGLRVAGWGEAVTLLRDLRGRRVPAAQYHPLR